MRDLMLAALFVITLAIPGLGLFLTADSTTMRFENRPAAPWPHDLAEGSVAAFERAFSDRFGGRDGLIWLHHAAVTFLFRTSPVQSVQLGRDGWLYFKGREGKTLERDYRRNPPPAATEIAAIKKGISDRIRYLEAMCADYLLVIVPDKYTIYPEFLPKSVKPLSPQSPLDALLVSLPPELRKHVLDLRPALLAAKGQRQLYFTTDSHWNESGAWVGYQEISAALKHGQYPQKSVALPPARSAGPVRGDLAVMLGIPSLFHEQDHYLVTVPETARCARTGTGALPSRESPRQSLYCPAAAHGKAFIYCDSMSVPLVPLLSHEFAESHWRREHRWNLRELNVSSPAIVIDEFVERDLLQLADVSFLDGDVDAGSGAQSPLPWNRCQPPSFTRNVRATGSCSIDQVNGVKVGNTIELGGHQGFEAEGWAADAVAGVLPSYIWMTLANGKQFFNVGARMGRHRPDVAAATGKPGLAKAGYRLVASGDGIPAGDYQMALVWSDPTGWFSCDLRPTLRVLGK